MSTCTEGCFRNVINLGNSIIGVSILAMPYCFQKCGILLSLVLILSSGLMTKVSCHLLLKAAIMARRRNFEFLAFHTFGPFGKFAVELGIIGFLLGTCIAFFVVIGDLGPPLVADLFFLEVTPGLRVEVLLFLGFFVALPLGLLRKVDSLTSFSFLSVCFYICLGLKILGESLPNLSSEVLWTQLNWWRPSGLLSTLPIFFMALSCQTQLFEIFDTVNEPSLKRMDTIVSSAVHMCSAVYSLVGLFGYIAFYDQTISGNILVKLSNTVLTKVVKMAFVVTVIVSFPLCLFPCRSSLHSLIYKQGLGLHDPSSGSSMIPDQRFRLLTLGLVAATISTAILLPDIEFVLGILGSTIGTLICFILPALVFIKNTNKNTNERLLAQAVLCIGLFILVACSYSTLHEPKSSKKPQSPIVAESSQLSDRYLTPKRPKPLVLKGQDASRLEEQFLQAKNVIENSIVITESIKKEPEKSAIGAPTDGNGAVVQQAAEKRQEPPVPQEPEEHQNKLNKIPEIKSLDVQPKPVPVDPEPKKNVKPALEDHAKNDNGVWEKEPKDAAQKSNNLADNVRNDNAQNDLHPDALKKEDKELGNKKPQVEKKIIEEGTNAKQEALLLKIEQQQLEQKKLLEEQRLVLQELKEHKESHDVHKASFPQSEPNNPGKDAVVSSNPKVQLQRVQDQGELRSPLEGPKKPSLEESRNQQAHLTKVKQENVPSPERPLSLLKAESEVGAPGLLGQKVAKNNPSYQVPVKDLEVQQHQFNEINSPLKPPAKQPAVVNINLTGLPDSKILPVQTNIQSLERRVMSERNMDTAVLGKKQIDVRKLLEIVTESVIPDRNLSHGSVMKTVQ